MYPKTEIGESCRSWIKTFSVFNRFKKIRDFAEKSHCDAGFAAAVTPK
jgi:hypothetical protein